MKNNKQYSEWSKRWSDVRSNVVNIDDNIDEVIKLWKTTPRGGWKRKTVVGGLGYRHHHKEGGGPRGEQRIEEQLFKKYLFTVEHNNSKCAFVPLYHKIPLANQKPEQRIADVFGLLLYNGAIHPLMVEVKEKADNCWYALVENLQQVKMARANPDFINSLLAKHKMPVTPAVWGMVLAPKDYFAENNKLTEAKKLLDALDKGTEKHCPIDARIAFAAYDKLRIHKINVIHSNWK